MTDTKCW